MAVGRMNIIRIILDSVTAGTIILLMDLQIIGLVLHEAIGLILYLLFVMHKYINRKWILGIGKAFFKKIPLKTRLNYILDFSMLAGFTLIIVSGAYISRTITWLPGGGAHIWKEIHIISSLTVFVISGVHVGLHFRFILKGLTKMAGALFLGMGVKRKPVAGSDSSE
ncbi:MAG: DUF4405 domain-containing protein [Bacteroidetes bacterium]|nr:DUF4405 domain-containing protein [Bacteroidota bacterium]